MARSNSKYFASVISKLVSARREENIVIDEAFKMELRSYLLTKAVAPVSSGGISFGEFFMKWRFIFAALPSALVVMLVAAQFLNMSVPIPTEQMVIDSGSKLHTFPGELVLPKDVFVEDVPVEDVFVEDVPVKKVDVKKVVPFSDLASSSAPAPAYVSQPYFYGFPFVYMPREVTKEPVDSVGEINVVDENNVYVAPQDTLNQTEVYHVNDSVVQVPASPQFAPNQDLNHVQIPSADLSVSGSSLLQTEIPSVSQPTLVLQVQQDSDVTSAPVLQVQPEASAVLEVPVNLAYTHVQYLFVLPQSQRGALESDIIPALVGARTSYSVKVYDKGNEIIAVQVTFSDSSILLRYYKYNSGSGSFDRVQYVESYYYDDSLTYTQN